MVDKIDKSVFRTLLCFSIRSGDCDRTKKILEDYADLTNLGDPDINEDGHLFGIAMKQSCQMLKLLIDIYVNTKMYGNLESDAKEKLKDMLEQQISCSPYELSEMDKETLEILKPWLEEGVGLKN